MFPPVNILNIYYIQSVNILNIYYIQSNITYVVKFSSTSSLC